MKSIHGTLVVFLQNDAGYVKWGPTPERIKELMLAYRPKEPVKPWAQSVLDTLHGQGEVGMV